MMGNLSHELMKDCSARCVQSHLERSDIAKVAALRRRQIARRGPEIRTNSDVALQINVHRIKLPISWRGTRFLIVVDVNGDGRKCCIPGVGVASDDLVDDRHYEIHILWLEVFGEYSLVLRVDGGALWYGGCEGGDGDCIVEGLVKDAALVVADGEDVVVSSEGMMAV